jgi:hypothetical protein
MPNQADELRREDVERRAYELYEKRGGEHGHDWRDWLQAEREVRGAERSAELRVAADKPSRRTRRRPR